jgi:hypothetical protein
MALRSVSGEIETNPLAVIKSSMEMLKKTGVFPFIQVFKTGMASSADELMFLLLVEQHGFDQAIEMASERRMRCDKLVGILRRYV